MLWVLIPDAAAAVLGNRERVSRRAGRRPASLNVPGALGVFEGGMLMLMQPAVLPKASLFSGAARVPRHLLPAAALVLALVVLLFDESYQRRHFVRRWGERVGELTITLAPKLIATFAFIAGAVLLFSGATPAATGRLALLARFLPEPVIELSHFLGSLVGLGAAAASRRRSPGASMPRGRSRSAASCSASRRSAQGRGLRRGDAAHPAADDRLRRAARIRRGRATLFEARSPACGSRA